MTSFADTQHVESDLALLLRARRALLLRKPFFGALAMGLRFRIDRRHPSCYTDAVVLGMNPDFLRSMSFEQLQTVIAHEVMHCALKHVFRLGNKNFDAWQEACDHVVNLMLLADGFEFPSGTIYCDAAFQRMSAEEVYSKVLHRHEKSEEEGDEADANGQAGSGGETGAGGGSPKALPTSGTFGEMLAPGSARGKPEGVEEQSQGDQQATAGAGDDASEDDDGHSDAGSPAKGDAEHDALEQPPQSDYESSDSLPLSEAESRALEEQWGQQAAAAAIQAKARGHGSDSLKRAVDASTKPEVNFRDHLRLFLQQAMRKETENWTRPSRRSQGAGSYLPSMRGAGLGTLVIAVDTSGSVSNKELSQFLGEIGQAQRDLHPEKIILTFADDRVQEEREFLEGEDTEDAASMVRGFGGTDFAPVYARCKQLEEEQGERIDGVIYLTDLDGSFPQDEGMLPPTLWVVSSSWRKMEAPFGEVVRLIW